MNIWAILMLVSAGLFAGSALAFTWERIPAWRIMPLPQYLTDFAGTIHRADRVQPALLVAAIATALAFSASASATARTLALVGAAGLIVTLIASVAVLVPLQRRIIVSSPQQPDTIETMRRRWFRGHFGRSALAMACFTLVAIAAVV